jgi:hypothetical protein
MGAAGMQKQYWSGIILIAIGVLILLYQIDLIDFSRADLVTYGCIFLGIIFLVKGVNDPQRHGIFGGVFFSVFGLSMLLMRERIFPRADEFGIALFFGSLALANLVYMIFKTDKTLNLIWGIIFAVVGGLFYWSYAGYYPPWYVYEQIKTFWPLALVILGVAMIVKGYAKKRDAIQVKGSEL